MSGKRIVDLLIHDIDSQQTEHTPKRAKVAHTVVDSSALPATTHTEIEMGTVTVTQTQTQIGEVEGEEDPLPNTLRAKGFAVEFIADKSWIALKRAYLSPSPEQFDATWSEHPATYQTIKMFGRDTPIPRYQQAYGHAYKYSGSVSNSVPETPLIARLRAMLNEDVLQNMPYAFNMCLCNWYEGQHYIGPHSDDTRRLHAHSPIASLSWGRERTFVLSPKTRTQTHSKLKTKAPTQRVSGGAVRKELTLRSGDLVIMGGHCQQTHKHEILKLKAHEAAGNRINFTFCCFK